MTSTNADLRPSSSKVRRTGWKYEAVSPLPNLNAPSVWIGASVKWLNSKLCAEDSRLAGQIKELCLIYISAGSSMALTANRFCYSASLMVDDWGKERESLGEEMRFSTCPSSFVCNRTSCLELCSGHALRDTGFEICLIWGGSMSLWLVWCFFPLANSVSEGRMVENSTEI